MGIRDLNKVLRNKCKNSTKIISLADLSGKIIAVDILNYLFKYAADETLIENIFLMISIFYYYKITPIFIFDGKSPPEKKELLIKKLICKQEAKKEFEILKLKLQNCDIKEESKKEILLNMDHLKKSFVSLQKEQIDKVKQLIRSYGAIYIEAPREAEELCAMLVLKNKVWACLSEDTDLFVYGCSRVLRYFSLLNHTAVLYDMDNILFELGLSQKQFREICILSGTDYNVSHSNYCLEKLFILYKKYLSLSNSSLSFCDWIKIDNNNLEKINNIFDLSIYTNPINTFVNENDNDFQNGTINNKKVREILEEDGFLFAKKIN